MPGFLVKVIIRVAVVLASLAWAGWVFSNTVGDVDRGEQVADAVLDDADARSELASLLAGSVAEGGGLSAEQQTELSGRIESLLADETRREGIVAPATAAYARMLGEDDQSATSVDVAGLVGAGGTAEGTPGSGPAYQVPMPDVQLGFLSSLRDATSSAVPALALLSALGFLAVALTGRWRLALRRFGRWSIAAGALWLAVPFAAVWAAQRWVDEADAIVSVGVRTAVGGLAFQAGTLVALGALSIIATLAIRKPSEATVPRRPAPRESPAAAVAVAPAVVPAAVIPVAEAAPIFGAGPAITSLPTGPADDPWSWYAPGGTGADRTGQSPDGHSS